MKSVNTVDYGYKLCHGFGVTTGLEVQFVHECCMNHLSAICHCLHLHAWNAVCNGILRSKDNVITNELNVIKQKYIYANQLCTRFTFNIRLN